MNICDKFDDETKHKFKELIFKNAEEDIEYGVAIYRDGSIGMPVKGKKGEILVDEGKERTGIFRKCNSRLGVFHTHRHISDRPELGGINFTLDPLDMSCGDVVRVIEDNDDIECIGSYIAYDKTYRIRCFIIDKNSKDYHRLKDNSFLQAGLVSSPSKIREDITKKICKKSCDINLGVGKNNSDDKLAEYVKKKYSEKWEESHEKFKKGISLIYNNQSHPDAATTKK